MPIKNLLNLHGMFATGHILLITTCILVGFFWKIDVLKSEPEKDNKGNLKCADDYYAIGFVFWVSARRLSLLVLCLLIGLLCINVKFFCAHLKHATEAFQKLGKKKTITSFVVAMALVGGILGISAAHAADFEPKKGEGSKSDLNSFRVYTVLALSCLMVLTHFGQAVYLVARSHAH
ncbi:hypothetical protein niasHS_007880 [Heterodera schachtii]|uniref:Uncharacterized protein n=1 Tax=Heterodera schachtii TaxID=97005 RepID=A0ABD2JPW9_HETSC